MVKERREIARRWRAGQGSALVTLVRAEGSSYRRPGARVLVGATAQSYAGTISGGCLEAEVVRKAGWLARSGAAVERYSMLFDDTAEVPFGLGCGGTVDLLFEPLETPEGEALLVAIENSLAGAESTVVHFLPGGERGLRRLVLASDGRVLFASAGLSAEKIACARGLVPGEEYEGRFVERLGAPQKLFVLGAGDDAKPLVTLASELGWDVTVADGRAQLARAERFPLATRVGGTDALDVRREDAVVLMTHSYEQDRRLLVAMLPLQPRYLGLLGSRHRSSLLVGEAAEMLGSSVEASCAGLFAPVGMDLGGDGPEAIALAILAEVQAVCHGREGSTRRLTAGQVEKYLEQGGVSRYLAECALGAG